MTGESIPTKENWKQLKPYYKKLVSICIILISSFLLVEHLWTYGRYDLLDFIGHEYYAMIGLLFIFLWNTDYKQWNKLKLYKIKNWFR